MNTNQFIKESIVTVVEKMEKTRKNKNAHEYGTLLDSLSHFISDLNKDNRTEVFGYFLKKRLIEEQNEISKLINESIENEDYKLHHRWTLVFHKLLSSMKYIGNIKQTKLDFYQNEGAYVFVSCFQHIAFENAFKVFDSHLGNAKKIEDDKFELRLGGKEYNIEIASILTPYSYTNNLKGDFLYIDENQMGIISYMRHIDPYLNGFKHVILT